MLFNLKTPMRKNIFIFLLFFPLLCSCSVNTTHKGEGYMITFPTGWEKGVDPVEFVSISSEEQEMITYHTPNKTVDQMETVANISVLTQKFTSDLWIGQVFKKSLLLVKKNNYTIEKQGETQLDGLSTFWVIYRDWDSEHRYYELFTINDPDIFVKIKLSVKYDQFEKYKNDFETTKNSFVLKFSPF